ncbi:MAG: hypothetical protein U0359_18700 [Byssovorax sp.]
MPSHKSFRRRYDPSAVLPSPAPPLAPGAPEERGVVYLALGAEHVSLAATSVSFLRRFGYRGKVRVVTDHASFPAADLDVEVVSIAQAGPPYSARHYKTRICAHGFPVTLFLDTDILPIAPIDPIFESLGSEPLALSLELMHTQSFLDHYWDDPAAPQQELRDTSELGLGAHPFYNSGVLLFRRSEVTDRLFLTWHEEWRRYGDWDQLALVRALARTAIKPRVLPSCWNYPPTHFTSIADAQGAGVKMLHFFSGPERDRLPDMLRAFSPGSAAAGPGQGG